MIPSSPKKYDEKSDEGAVFNVLQKLDLFIKNAIDDIKKNNNIVD